MSKITRRSIFLGVLFSIAAITFALLYVFKVINYFNLILCVIYVSYFLGLALFYNGRYNRIELHPKATALNFIFGFLFIAIATGFLIYGFIIGAVTLWW